IAGRPYSPDRVYTVAAAGMRGIPGSAGSSGTGVHAIDALSRHLGAGEVRPAVSGRTFVAQ
ncbi:MAG TPA: hypothetical protein VK966_07870, partial [Longimicrobiales bacterium]|nr:hypothetical protein [Longimicrobiales bacterium]